MTTPRKQRPADAAYKLKKNMRALWSAAARFLTAILPAAAGKALHAGYVLCYTVGVHTLRVGKRSGRLMGRILRPAGRLAYKAADKLLLRHLRAMRQELGRMREGFVLAGRRLKEAYRRHPLLVIPQALCLPVKALHRHRKAVASTFNLLAPAAAVMVLVLTLQFWSSATLRAGPRIRRPHTRLYRG